jgi:hypothetical protein
MLFSPMFPLVVVESDGFCAPVFNPTLNQNGNIGTLTGPYTYFCMVPASAMTLGGLDGDVSQVRVTFMAGTSSPMRIKKAFIGHKDSSTPYHFDGHTAAQLFFNGSNEDIVISTNGTAVGTADFAWDKTSDLLITIDFDEGTNSHAWATVTGCRTFDTTSYYAANPAVPPETCFAKETTLNANGNGAQGYTYRSRIPAANLNLSGFTGPGDTAIFSMISSLTAGYGLRINKLYIGHAAASGHAYSGTPVQCTFPNNGGGTTCNVTTAGTRVVAEAAFAYDGTSDIIIGCSFAPSSGNVGHRANSSVSGENTYSKAASTEADATNPSGFSLTSNYSWIERLEFYPRTCPLGISPANVTEATAGYCPIKQISANGCGEDEEPEYLTRLLLPLLTDYQDISNSNHTVTYVGAAPIIDNLGSPAGSPFSSGENRWRNTSSGAVLVVADSEDFDFADGDFTIEFWHMPGGAQNSTIPIFSKLTDPISDTYGPFKLVYNPVGNAANNRTMSFYASSVGATSWDLVNGLELPSFSDSFPVSTAWYHYAITREGNVWRTFWRGLLQNSVTQAGTMQSNSANLTIGGPSAASNRRTGRWSDIRITKGLARYTANFTPPSSRFTPD